MTALRVTCGVAIWIGLASSAFAQNWSFDARRIALGSVGGHENLASSMVDERREYRSIVLPFGLFQVLRDFDRLRPDSDSFDLVRTVEYVASPLHYVFGRDRRAVSGRDLMTDIRQAGLSRDLSDYRGIQLSSQPRAEGLTAPHWGRTIRIAGDRTGAFQGIYVGAGPYLAMRTAASIDQQVVDILGSEQPLRFANDQFDLSNDTEGQLALAITGGYRGRFAAGAGSSRDGIYVAANYNYLHGFRYEHLESALRLDTDRNGLLTVSTSPLLPSPLLIAHTNATAGSGFAIDAGVSAVIRGWEMGVGVNGIANRIKWTGAERTTYGLTNLFLGDDQFVESVPVQAGDITVRLPVDYRVTGGYHAAGWSAVSEYGHGFQGDSLRGGFEYRFRTIELRGGAFHSNNKWEPSTGVGLNMGRRVGVDVALFGTSANAARERRPAVAVSLRFNH